MIRSTDRRTSQYIESLVNFFSNSHFLLSTLTELAQLTGIAALLRFPMPELEDSDDDDDEDGAAGGDNSDSD